MNLQLLVWYQTKSPGILPYRHVRFSGCAGFASRSCRDRRASMNHTNRRQTVAIVLFSCTRGSGLLSGQIVAGTVLRHLHVFRLFAFVSVRLAPTTSRPFSSVPNGFSAGQAQMAAVGLDEDAGNPPDSLQGDRAPENGPDVVSLDPESDENVPVDPEELTEVISRPPPVNSDYLPLPWRGRLGYACLNTYLRYSKPPVFCSRTCRITSILENRHPLRDPSQLPHPTKNRPDRSQPADVARGQRFVESLGLANARDIVKIIRWNDRYGIKFMRLSSEMFPFASHSEYGYKVAPFASKVLEEAGHAIAELGHRVSVHPGQFTQLGTPRKEVVEASVRDLEYHSEMLDLLKLPPQQDRDAVIVLHMGGVFGDKAATLDRFRGNYKRLSQGIKNRLVLENDDVSWSVHDLLPVCEELNIPLVLDFHHHNIIFDSSQVREGTLDVTGLFDRIKTTWTRKGITQKMHYSEPVPSAITNRQRRKHRDRVTTLPPCDPTMDLMIEAKDKEQAVFELMRVFKLPGHSLFNDMIPHIRNDENKPVKSPRRSTKRKKGDSTDVENCVSPSQTIPDHEVGMGGPEGRVYWPPGMEEWLRPAKRVVRTKTVKLTRKASARKAVAEGNVGTSPEGSENPNNAPEIATPARRKKRKVSKTESTPSSSEDDPADNVPTGLPDNSTSQTRVVRRSRRVKKMNYAEDSDLYDYQEL